MKKSNIAYKFLIEPNKEQILMFEKTFGCARFIYNHSLNDMINYYEVNKKMLHQTPASYKREFPFLKEVDSLALANSVLNLYTAFKNFFDKKERGYPNFKSKKRSKNSYTTNNQKGTIRIENDYIKLPKIGFVKLIKHREIPDNYKIKSATISKTPDNKYYVSILLEYENQVQEVEVKKVIGLDFSIPNLCVDSNGITHDIPLNCFSLDTKIEREQRKLSKMVPSSKNYQKQKVRVAKLMIKRANRLNDFLHKESKIIVDGNDAVCIENLNMQAMSQTLNFGKKVHEKGWGKFTTFLKYKLERQGKKLIKVGKLFPSSQLCSNCGYQNHDTKDLSVREWLCPECGHYHNRDVNAAINIRNEGIRLLTETI